MLARVPIDASYTLGLTQVLNAVRISLYMSAVVFEKLLSILLSSDHSTPKAERFFNEHQQSILSYLYSIKPFPTHAEMEKMANMLGLGYSSVNGWFKNQRYRYKQVSKFQSTQCHLGKLLHVQLHVGRVHVDKLFE